MAYTPTQWNTGDVITKEKMNNIENGIVSHEQEINNLKTSVSEGKAAVAGAITDKGVSTSSTATFSTLAENIGKISTGSGTLDRTNITTTSSITLVSGYPNGPIVLDIPYITPEKLAVLSIQAGSTRSYNENNIQNIVSDFKTYCTTNGSTNGYILNMDILFEFGKPIMVSETHFANQGGLLQWNSTVNVAASILNTYINVTKNSNNTRVTINLNVAYANGKFVDYSKWTYDPFSSLSLQAQYFN